VAGLRTFLQDIQTLNERALRGSCTFTAISIHAYPYVADNMPSRIAAQHG